jgi:hypothetical protein
MKKAISSISEKYPPGEGLKKEQEYLMTALENLKYKGEFIHQPSPLITPEDKQNQLEKIIMEYASIAKKKRDDF